jgi:transposase InsO family protein
MSGEHPTVLLCATLGASRSGYYAWCRQRCSPRTQHNQTLLGQIRTVHTASRGTYGSPRVTRTLCAQGERVGHNRVARLMRAAGLWGRQRRRYRVLTTDSQHTEPIAPNRLATQPAPTRPDQVWVSDLT